MIYDPGPEIRPALSMYGYCDTLDAEAFLREFIETNWVSAANPYHNLGHAFRVVESAMQAGRFDVGLVQPWTSYEYRTCFVAALFHDWQHPGGVGVKDSQNVQRAAQKVLSLPKLPEAPFDHQVAAQAILDTVYPLPPGGELSYMGLILRDADLWHSGFMTESELFSQVVVPLSQEMHMTVGEMCVREAKFFREAPAYTDWAKEVRRQEAPRLAQHCENMATLLGEKF